MNPSKNYLFLIAAVTLFFTGACDVFDSNTNNNKLTAPESYEFTRNGESSVAYPGQTDRLAMVEEMKSYLTNGDEGALLSEQVLIDMFENTGGNGGGNFSFNSDRQLKNKTFAPDIDANLFGDLFARAETASQNGNNGVTAQDGIAGLLTRENSGNTILVDENGREFVQFVEKGLMGAVFYNQIFNVYLSDDRIGPNVNNEQLEAGKNYTDKEHHFDEAYGYWNAPRDFGSPWPETRTAELRFWNKYSNVVDDVSSGLLGTNQIIQDAFIKGRTAIVNDNQEALNEQVDILYDALELVAAATTVHYINGTLLHLSNQNTGEAFHTLSEAWAFANALKYNPRRKISLSAIQQMKETDFGQNGNFWNVTTTGLNNAKSTLVNTYPELEPVQDQL